MKLVDSHVWLALVLSGHSHHGAAHDWLRTEVSAGELRFCRATQQSFLLLTASAVLRPFGNPPLTNAEAWEVYQGLLADARVGFAEEPADLESSWAKLAVRDLASPKLWMDSYRAAFAICGGYRLVTIDAAFEQYDRLDLLLLDRA